MKKRKRQPHLKRSQNKYHKDGIQELNLREWQIYHRQQKIYKSRLGCTQSSKSDYTERHIDLLCCDSTIKEV